MNRFRISYIQDLYPAEEVQCTYYCLEDAFLHFKSADHKHLRSIAAGLVWSVERFNR